MDRFSVDTFDAFSSAVAAAADDPASLAPRFAIERRDEGTVVSAPSSMPSAPGPRVIDVWYILGDREARGRGFGKESVRLLTDHLLQERARWRRVGATLCDVENVAVGTDCSTDSASATKGRYERRCSTTGDGTTSVSMASLAGVASEGSSRLNPTRSPRHRNGRLQRNSGNSPGGA